MVDNLYTINSCKFDGSIHKSWTAEYLSETNDYWAFVGEFSEEINHSRLGRIKNKTVSYEYYWKEKWYNVFRFHEPDGSLRNFYCNINQPPTLSNHTLNYIDLDIDILVWSDFKIEVLDIDEFDDNAKIYGYPDYIKKTAEIALNDLLEKIDLRKFPFNYAEVTV